jgi:hypothetical protein
LTFNIYFKVFATTHNKLGVQLLGQGILKGEVSLYR